MSEEVRKSRTAVPSTIFWTVALNGILAYAFSLAILFCLGDLDAAVNASFPFIEVCMQATGSKRAATAMVSGLLVISFAVTLSSIASASRLTWAWARDGGLPVWFAYVSPRHRVPVRAIGLPIVVVMCLACLNIGSSTAFSAFISLASLALFASYAIAIGCMLYARRSKESEGRRWSLGTYGTPINIFALIYTGWMMVIFCFPQYRPVTATNFNYALPIFAGIVLLAVTFWFLRAKRTWAGLDKETIKRVLEDADSERTY